MVNNQNDRHSVQLPPIAMPPVATPPVAMAPGQHTMIRPANQTIHPFTINLTNSCQMMYGGKINDFIEDSMPLANVVREICCPCVFGFSWWASAYQKMQYERIYTPPCSCKWHVFIDDSRGRKLVGKVKKSSCWEDGIFFCLCPCLACSGRIKITGIEDEAGVEMITLQKELFCCWPCVQGCATLCAPFGILAQSMSACCKYANGVDTLTITQPVFKGPWKRGETEEELGRLIQINRWKPMSCCCAQSTPMRLYFQPARGMTFTDEYFVLVGLLLHLYRGIPVPCRMCGCGGAGFQTPFGLSCLDMGLMTTTDWYSVQEAERVRVDTE